MPSPSLRPGRAHTAYVLCPPTHMLLYLTYTCSVNLLLGLRGAQGFNINSSCILTNASHFISVTVSQSNKLVNLTSDRTDVISALCEICNCTHSPCSCSQVNSDLAWVTTHPLQHLLLLLTILLPNQFHLRRPRTARATAAATM
ncbi:GP3 protein [Southwest baboon virus 1]|uniref:GP3 protein n=1 Tax=Southwest baboon virus 1 TaxID=1546178 RepID=UPI0004F5EFED|nr:GP3 protein [Southwest baboon virus 1]AIP91331.1 GP3 protein [Southwest baboon virus 1]